MVPKKAGKTVLQPTQTRKSPKRQTSAWNCGRSGWWARRSGEIPRSPRLARRALPAMAKPGAGVSLPSSDPGPLEEDESDEPQQPSPQQPLSLDEEEPSSLQQPQQGITHPPPPPPDEPWQVHAAVASPQARAHSPRAQ